MDQKQIKKIKGLLSKEKTIVIIPHKNPDGDAIGSSTALDSYLKKLGHKSLIICPNHFPKLTNHGTRPPFFCKKNGSNLV